MLVLQCFFSKGEMKWMIQNPLGAILCIVFFDIQEKIISSGDAEASGHIFIIPHGGQKNRTLVQVNSPFRQWPTFDSSLTQIFRKRKSRAGVCISQKHFPCFFYLYFLLGSSWIRYSFNSKYFLRFPLNPCKYFAFTPFFDKELCKSAAH